MVMGFLRSKEGQGATISVRPLLRAARAYEAITANAEWRSAEPTQLALADDPQARSPMERAATLA